MSARGGLPPLHLLLALGVMAVWGTNFVVIKLALAHLPPLTLAALRFSLAYQIAAMALAVTGLGVIGWHTDGSATPLGLLLVLGAALSWSLGNMTARAAGPVPMLNYVVWSSVFAVPPLFGMALLTEGWPRMAAGIAAADSATWAAVVWQAVGNTMFGYAAWGWLLGQHPAAQVAPLALLVPVFGLGSSALLLGEALQWWEILAFVLVMAGLSLGVLWPRFMQKAAA